MSEMYSEKTGSRKECTAVDSENVLSSLRQGRFQVSTSAATYVPEQYTTNYTKSIFDTISKLEDYWSKCKQTAGRFIDNFENVPLPDDNEESLKADYLDDVSVSTGLGVATITASNLNIRKNPNMDSQVVSYGKNGDQYEVLGYSENGKWVKIKLANGEEAYISAKYTKVENNKVPLVEDTIKEEDEVETLTNENVSTQKEKETTPLEIVKEIKKEKIETVPETKKIEIVTEINNDTSNKETATITASSLNIRKDPNMNSQIVGFGKTGDQYEVLGYSENGKWVKIKLANGEEAYIGRKYTNVSNSNPSQNITPSPMVEKVSTNSSNSSSIGIVSTKTRNLNVRSDASLDSKIVGSIPRNQEVEILDYNKDSQWVKIMYNGKPQYVYKDFIKMKGE